MEPVNNKIKYSVPKDFLGNSDDYLRHKVMNAFDNSRLCYGDEGLNYIARVNRELLAIQRQGLADLFLICSDLVTFLRNSFLVSPGWDRINGSVVCYLLGITKINPIEHGLLFEFFMSEDDDWFTGIDIETDSEGIKAGNEYLLSNFGEVTNIRFELIFSKSECEKIIERNSAEPNRLIQYREDVMKFLQSELYISPSESNRLRILIGKGDVEANNYLDKRLCSKFGKNLGESWCFALHLPIVSKSWITSRTKLLEMWDSIL